jgi:hypothetical protein
MAALTREQERKADVASAASLRAHRAAGKLPKDECLEARARQAQTYIDTIHTLGIPSDDEKVADLIRQAEVNITRWDRYTTLPSPPPRVTVPRRVAPMPCLMPGCSYLGPPGTCPTHDLST